MAITPPTDTSPKQAQWATSSRLSDEEIRDRMLAAGQDAAMALGIVASVQHLPFERIIQAANVSRTAVYRLWSDREAYLNDLLLSLAAPEFQGASNSTEILQADLLEILADADLSTLEGRREFVLSALREGAHRNYLQAKSSHEWFAYLALNTTVQLGSDTTNAEVVNGLRERLRVSETGALERVAAIYESICQVCGYRLRPEFNGDYLTMAHLGALAIESFAVRSVLFGDIGSMNIVGPNFDTENPDREWSLVAFACASVLLNVLEPDPDWVLPDHLSARPPQ